MVQMSTENDRKRMETTENDVLANRERRGSVVRKAVAGAEIPTTPHKLLTWYFLYFPLFSDLYSTRIVASKSSSNNDITLSINLQLLFSTTVLCDLVTRVC